MDEQVVDGCWAASLGDCEGKLSREHTISECLFASGKVTVSGFPWCKGQLKTIGVSNLTRWILCKHHNNRLSDLDSAMLTFFDAVRESARLNKLRTKLRQNAWSPLRLTVDGRLLERWFLKTLININYEGGLKFGDDGETPGIPTKEIVEIAFGHRTFSEHAGLYVARRAGETVAMYDGVTVRALTECDRISAAEFTVFGYRFILSLVPEPVSEFAGSQLLQNEVKMWFRVPNRKGKMVRSHMIHITR